MSVINDPAEISGLLGIRAVPLTEDLLGGLHKLVLDLLGAQDVVGSDAGLTWVDELAPQHSLGGYHDVTRVVDVDRAEDTEIKC